MSDYIFNIVIEVIKTVGAIVPAVLNFLSSRKTAKDKKHSDDN